MTPEEIFDRDYANGDAFREGYYLLERAGRVALPVRVFWGPPLDADGAPLDRSPRWQVAVGGKIVGSEDPPIIFGWELDTIEDVWPRCARFPIDQDDYDYRAERRLWAQKYDENDAHGNDRRIDPRTVTLPNMEIS